MNILIPDTPQLLQKVVEEVNFIFENSKPEPFNYRWRIGQMVIIQYHFDKLWYRGIVLDVSILFNSKTSVLFFKIT